MTKQQAYERIREMQRENDDAAFFDEGFTIADLQRLIDTGQAWHTSGSIGRAAMRAMEAGVCMLGDKVRRDAYGNPVPSYDLVSDGTKGSLQLAADYWGIELSE